MTDEQAPADSTGYRVEVDGAGPCWLLGNGQTFPGRMVVKVIATGEKLHVSKGGVIGASPEAAIWIEGFLAGQEPDYDTWLGLPDDAPVDTAVYDDPRNLAGYRAFLQALHDLGRLPYELDRRPAEPPPPGWADRAWVMVAGEVTGWDGTAWAPRDPQPAVDFDVLRGTACDGTGHDLEVVRYGVMACSACGRWVTGLEWDDDDAAEDGA